MGVQYSTMAIDPQKCHANARQCIDLAAGTKHPELKKTFLMLADKWTLLATKLEKARHNGRPSARSAPPLLS
jgi:hypothetical protein